MLIRNATPMPATVLCNANDDDSIAATAMVVVTCDIRPGRLSASEHQLPLLLDPGLPFPSDAMFVDCGVVSVTAYGHVYAPGGRAREALAAIEVGERRLEVLAIGPRVWRRGVLGLTQTRAIPFERVPMIWQRAYGGRVAQPAILAKHDGEQLLVPGHEASFQLNMDGVGYYRSVEQATDQPLPQLEDPMRRIVDWRDQPEPRCFAPYPLWGGLRAQHVLDAEHRYHPDRARRLCSRAIPALTFAAIEAGARIRIEGMRPDGEVLELRVPEPMIEVTARVADDVTEVPLRLEAIDIDSDAATARLLYRGPFVYDLIRYEMREVAFTPSPAFAAIH